MGDVIHLQRSVATQHATRLCSNCEHAYHGPTGIFCRVFNEDIVLETEAQECEAFDPLPWASEGSPP